MEWNSNWYRNLQNFANRLKDLYQKSKKANLSFICPPPHTPPNPPVWKKTKFCLLQTSWHWLQNSSEVKVRPSFEAWVKYWSSIYGKCSAWKAFVSSKELQFSKFLDQNLSQSLSCTVDLLALYFDSMSALKSFETYQTMTAMNERTLQQLVHLFVC